MLAVDLREQPASAEETLDGELSPTTAPRSRSQREFRRSDEVGRYVILERVGAGGMGVVYAAWDPKLDRKVALKLLHSEQQSHGQRLEREAQAMARLAHPNVITVHDVGEVEGRVFVAMEFVEGETLGSWARLAGGRGASAPRAEPKPKPEPRRWSEILEVLLAAGRGLAAAHAQGLIHRDFKPDNVMIGADGRVRVMDFGLVRETNAASVPRIPTARTQALEALSLDSPSALESQLTIAGSLLGTPAYMAPEQLRGDEADARADQFSFCVAAWQCLYGVRPFTGDSPLAVLYAITHAKFSDFPPSTSRTVPTRVRRALERGLASDPAARWPDMPQLLAALANATASTRRPRLVGIASLGLAAAAATAAIWVQRSPPPDPCEHAGDELRELWTAERRAGLELRFRSSALIYADETWDRVGVALDDWGAEFVGARRATCEDSEIRHEQSAELLDLRMACLDQRLARFAALVELLAAADDTVIEKAVEAVEALPKLEVCSDRSWLTATVRPPEDPALAAAVAELREDLAKIEVMTDAGKAPEVVELAAATEANAAELAWAPIVAEASLQLGRVRLEVGEFSESRAALERAFFAARRSGHDEVAAEAGFRLVYGLSLGLGEFEAAAGWIDHALAEAERIGRSDLLAEVHSAIGIHHYVKSENELAAKAFARALELHARSTSSSLAAAHINYGTILARVEHGQRERAFAELDLGLNMLEQALGPRHPSVAVALSNYATVHGTYNQRHEAIALLERALEINRGALGPKHPMTALVELNLSNNLIESDERVDLQRALEFAERSAASHREIFGEQHGMVAQSELAIGRALRLLGRPDQAITHVDAAFAIWSATLGEANRDTDHARLIRARCDVDLGEPVEARAKLELILSHEPDAKVLNQARLDLAELILDDDPRHAAVLLEQAKSYFEETGDVRRNQRIAALGRALKDPRLR